jgi:hypothetical protein
MNISKNMPGGLNSMGTEAKNDQLIEVQGPENLADDVKQMLNIMLHVLIRLAEHRNRYHKSFLNKARLLPQKF